MGRDTRRRFHGCAQRSPTKAEMKYGSHSKEPWQQQRCLSKSHNNDLPAVWDQKALPNGGRLTLLSCEPNHFGEGSLARFNDGLGCNAGDERRATAGRSDRPVRVLKRVALARRG